MDDTTPGVDDDATPGVGTPGVDDDVPDAVNESDKTKIEPTNGEHTSGAELVRTTKKRIKPQALQQCLQHHRRN